VSLVGLASLRAELAALLGAPVTLAVRAAQPQGRRATPPSATRCAPCERGAPGLPDDSAPTGSSGALGRLEGIRAAAEDIRAFAAGLDEARLLPCPRRTGAPSGR
jgi:hypothetical protein